MSRSNEQTVGAIQAFVEDDKDSAKSVDWDPHYALAAAVVAAPNLSMHLVTPLSVGVHKNVLFSMIAVSCVGGSSWGRWG